MTERDPGELPQSMEFHDPHAELFTIVEARYREASWDQDFHPDFVYLKTETSDDLGPIAKFWLVNNFEDHMNNQGEILEVQVQLAEVGDFASGLMLLEPKVGAERKLIIRNLKNIKGRPKRSRKLMITDSEARPMDGYFWGELHGHKREEHLRKLAKKLKDFKPMPIMAPEAEPDLSTNVEEEA